MYTPFASLQSGLNSAVIGALANATLTWGVSSSADGVFDNRSNTLLGDLVSGSDPMFTGMTALIGAIAYGTAVAVSGVPYTVVRNEPDGTGLTTLTLQAA